MTRMRKHTRPWVDYQKGGLKLGKLKPLLEGFRRRNNRVETCINGVFTEVYAVIARMIDCISNVVEIA